METQIDLSTNLEDKISFETYGLFMTPVTKYSSPEFIDLILNWMKNEDFVDINERSQICHNVQQVGRTNKILKDLPELRQFLLDVAHKHNDSGYNYASQFEISDCYVEIANEGAIYAPHEHSNCLFSGTYFINYQQDQHSYLKFKRNVLSSMFPVMMLPYKQMTAFNLQEATIPYKAGDAVIYPSNLTHGYESNLVGERITLTFNVIPV